MHIVPPMVLFLAKHDLVPKYDLSSVHTFFTAAAPVGEEMMDAAIERIGSKQLRFRQGITISAMMIRRAFFTSEKRTSRNLPFSMLLNVGPWISYMTTII